MFQFFCRFGQFFKISDVATAKGHFGDDTRNTRDGRSRFRWQLAFCVELGPQIFKDICDRAKVPYQTFVNRSDMAGGSTLGNISNTQVPVKTVDIGLAQLAMHSVYETTGAKDTESLVKAATVFFA